MMQKPRVFLVGAGPGDPGLLTLKGKEAIERADVLVYDRLIAPRLLDFAKPGCDLVYVGKEPQRHALPQDDINALLVEKARQGKVVVRLKGGDPFVFGRGGEEAACLREHGIDFDVVPGVTSAVAAPAYAGIPVTDRRAASSFTVVTGHGRLDEGCTPIPWEHLAKLGGTLVFMMGMSKLGLIAHRLMEGGMDPATPVAVVYRATQPLQQTVSARLEDIEEQVARHGLKNPSVIVVGRVVELRESLQWAERKPLFGKSFVVTRARHQASSLAAGLEELGAQVLECPLIAIKPPSDPRALHEALASLRSFDWIVFTSANGVEAFFEELAAQGMDARDLAGKQLVAVGEATKSALGRFGLYRVLMPKSYFSEGVAELLADKLAPGARVLMPRAEEARDVLVKVLHERGAQVSDVPAYRVDVAEGCRAALVEALEERAVDAVTFTSSSTVHKLMGLIGPRTELLSGVALYSIGPIASRTLRDYGFEPRAEASRSTIEGLVESIMQSSGGTQ